MYARESKIRCSLARWIHRLAFIPIYSEHIIFTIYWLLLVILNASNAFPTRWHNILINCLLHKLYPTNHHSSQEGAIYGMSCLLIAFLNPATCHLSNPKSINLILSLSLLVAFCFLLYSFVGALYRPLWPFLNITH